NKAGVKEKLYEAYTQGDKDFNALVSKLKAAAIDVVYVGGYHTEAGLILRQMRDQGMKAQMISGDAIATNEFWSITGPAGEGMLFTVGPDPRKKPPAAAEVKKIKDKGTDPEAYTLYTHAPLQVWLAAGKTAGTTAANRVKHAPWNDELRAREANAAWARSRPLCNSTLGYDTHLRFEIVDRIVLDHRHADLD